MRNSKLRDRFRGGSTKNLRSSRNKTISPQDSEEDNLHDEMDFKKDKDDDSSKRFKSDNVKYDKEKRAANIQMKKDLRVRQAYSGHDELNDTEQSSS